MPMIQHKIKLCNLSYSNVFYKTLFDICPDSMVAISVDVGKIVDFNENACSSLGYTRDEFLKLDIFDFDVTETQTEIMAHVERIAQKGEEVYFTKHRRKDGRILDIEVRAKFVEINRDKFIFCIWRDVTEFKRIVKESEELRRSMDELNKLRQILNICTCCKRICDEYGNWEPMDKFMSHNRSHDPANNLCPACLKRKSPKA
jgi:PAS domain S-box-containing protein